MTSFQLFIMVTIAAFIFIPKEELEQETPMSILKAFVMFAILCFFIGQ